MRKRKREKFIYYDDEPPSKKLKALSVEDQKIFLKGSTYQVFDVNESEFEERKFEDVLDDENTHILFPEHKMKTEKEQLQFTKYVMKNPNEFNSVVRQPPPYEFPESPESAQASVKFSDWKKKDPNDLIVEYFRKSRRDCHWDILDPTNFVVGSDSEVVSLSKVVYMRWKEAQGVFKDSHTCGKEDNRKKYIDEVVKVVVSDFKKNGSEERKSLVVDVEPRISGVFAHGEVEYVVKYGLNSDILLIVEAKKDDIEGGLSQLIIQLISSYQENLENEKELDYIYGFVTDGGRWTPVRMKYSEKEKIIEIGNECAIPAAYTNEKEMTRSMEQVIYVMREMLKRGVEDFNSKTQ